MHVKLEKWNKVWYELFCAWNIKHIIQCVCFIVITLLEEKDEGKRKVFYIIKYYTDFKVSIKKDRRSCEKSYLLDQCFGYLNKWLCHMWRSLERCTDYFLFSAWESRERKREREGQARGIFLSGSDLHRGHYSRDDVVIRYAGSHDAAFDVNCEERRSRSRFIPPSSFASRRRCRRTCKHPTVVSQDARVHPASILCTRSKDGQAHLQTPFNPRGLLNKLIMRRIFSSQIRNIIPTDTVWTLRNAKCN